MEMETENDEPECKKRKCEDGKSMEKLLERIVMSIEANSRAIESVKGSMDRMNDSFKGLQRTMEEIKYEIKESREENRRRVEGNNRHEGHRESNITNSRQRTSYTSDNRHHSREFNRERHREQDREDKNGNNNKRRNNENDERQHKTQGKEQSNRNTEEKNKKLKEGRSVLKSVINKI
ncbi:pre-mRNA-splicing factor CWC22 homolog [Ruditapes philippinarum]|uniref:pre-mRNA-splicing factor CWC22 homolog n=1 Tax=Ruditapes philippinarum TaxID=129788 RepID=UPI00295AAACA|nr:pre-mRNA-splicing factor CWC22 homolog [Ruditapes philippinarum]